MELGTNGRGHLATESWLKHTWKFLAEHGMMCISDGSPNMTLRWELDSLQIDEFVSARHTGETLRILN